MDKIWDRNPSKSEVIVAGMKKPNATQNRQKSKAKTKNTTKYQSILEDFWGKFVFSLCI